MKLPESIKILANDIPTSSYTNSMDCAITRALRRAGINGRDGVGVIYLDNSFKEMGKFVEEDYRIVQGMYKYLDANKWPEELVPVEPRDFDLHIIPYEYDDSDL